jgi:hypothetical protein
VSIYRRPATQPLGLRWDFETTSRSCPTVKNQKNASTTKMNIGRTNAACQAQKGTSKLQDVPLYQKIKMRP